MATKITVDQVKHIYNHFKANQVHPGKWPTEKPVELILGAIFAQNTTGPMSKRLWIICDQLLDLMRKK